MIKININCQEHALEYKRKLQNSIAYQKEENKKYITAALTQLEDISDKVSD